LVDNYLILQEPAREIAAPEGWVHAQQFDPFEAYLGPYFDRVRDGLREYAFIVDDRHTNAAGIAHGGALMTFADSCLGYSIWDATDRSPCVTISQQTNFLAAAKVGDLITCRPEVMRKTREIIFMRADLRVAATTIFTATAVWRIWPKV
jgi:uncharacterized protein (TIGR00369 family)